LQAAIKATTGRGHAASPVVEDFRFERQRIARDALPVQTTKKCARLPDGQDYTLSMK